MWKLRTKEGDVLMTFEAGVYQLPDGRSIEQGALTADNWPDREFWIGLEPGTKWVTDEL